jgi:mannitol-specific phosphotransferase system IIBC component
MNFKLPRNIISNNILKNVLYLVTSALAVSYIINEQSLALLSLIVIACGVYVMNKSVVIALFVSIIITNLLLSMNYLKDYDVIEGNRNRTKPTLTKPTLTKPTIQEEPKEETEQNQK